MAFKFDNLYDKVIARLEAELPEHYTYHSADHTRYVVEKVEEIAIKEKVSKKNIKLLKIAALFHDTGFIKSSENHEAKGCKIATKELQKLDFSEKDINTICGMIMATKIPQSPKSHLEAILADADLEYLATSRFKEIGDMLYEELKTSNPKFSKKQWNDIQISFMSKHEYHTDYCKRYKEWRKQKNLLGLK